MPQPFTSLGPLTLRTFTVMVALAIAAGMVIAVRALHRQGVRPGAAADISLAALLGGVFGARALHVLLHWTYFQEHTAEITRLRAGGLDWHGAFAGALIGLALMGRLRGADIRALLGALALVIPAVGFMAWWGCGANLCAYGAEVATMADYPAALVWEAPDIYTLPAPRFRTQALGMGAMFVLGIGLWISQRRGWLAKYPERRFWLSGMLAAAIMFALSFLRGDADDLAVWAGLRADQWLDALAIIGCGLLLIWPRRHTTGESPENRTA